MTKVNVGQVITLQAGKTFYYQRTPEDMRRLEQHDIDTGNTLDAGGEPRVYKAQSNVRLREDVAVTVTKTRNVLWTGWTNKPRFLVEGFATVDGVPRTITFVCPDL